MKSEDKRKVIYALQESVYISRWSDNKESLSAVLTPDETRDIVNNIFKELDNAGYEIVKKQDIKVKNTSLEEWEKWIKSELEPPVIIKDELKYVLEAFLELIDKTK